MIYFAAFKLQQLILAEREGRVTLPSYFTPKDIDRMFNKLLGGMKR